LGIRERRIRSRIERIRIEMVPSVDHGAIAIGCRTLRIRIADCRIANPRIEVAWGRAASRAE
jgi:hypothetical protein